MILSGSTLEALFDGIGQVLGKVKKVSLQTHPEDERNDIDVILMHLGKMREAVNTDLALFTRKGA